MGSGAISGLAQKQVLTFCDAGQPIRWSVKDTDETIRQARAHNAIGRKICGWK